MWLLDWFWNVLSYLGTQRRWRQAEERDAREEGERRKNREGAEGAEERERASAGERMGRATEEDQGAVVLNAEEASCVGHE